MADTRTLSGGVRGAGKAETVATAGPEGRKAGPAPAVRKVGQQAGRASAVEVRAAVEAAQATTAEVTSVECAAEFSG